MEIKGFQRRNSQPEPATDFYQMEESDHLLAQYFGKSRFSRGSNSSFILLIRIKY